MKSKLSFEELDTPFVTDPIQVTEVTEASDGVDVEAALAEDTAELAQLTNAADTLGRVSEAMEGYIPTRPNKAASAALDAAVRGVLRLSAPGVSAAPMVALEGYVGYPTQERRQAVAMENLQSIKDAFKKVIEKIKEVIARVIEWLKKTINRSKFRSAQLAQRAEAIHQSVRQGQAQKKAGVVAERIDGEKIYNAQIARVLSQYGQAPVPGNMKTALSNHSHQIRTILMNYDHIVGDMLKKAALAEGLLDGSDENWRSIIHSINYQLSNGPGGTDRGVQTTQGRETRLFEIPLVFDSRSVFHEAPMVGDDGVARGVHQLYVRKSIKANVYSANEGDYVYALNWQQIDQINEIVKDHLNSRQSIENATDRRLGELGKLGREFEHYGIVFPATAETYARAREMFHITTSILALMSLLYSSLKNYDDRVLNAALTYVEKSAAALAPNAAATAV